MFVWMGTSHLQGFSQLNRQANRTEKMSYKRTFRLHLKIKLRKVKCNYKEFPFYSNAITAMSFFKNISTKKMLGFLGFFFNKHNLEI